MVRENLKLAFPEKPTNELKRIEKEFYTHMCDMFLEMIKSLTISKKEIQKRFTFTNLDLIKEYETKNKSIVLMCGHYASYEWLMSAGYQINHTGYAVYQPLGNKYFDKLVKRIRTKHGVELLSRYQTTKSIQKHKKEGEIAMYGLASDQSPQKHRAKYWRTFLGVYVPVFVGAEKIAKDLDCPVIFMDAQKVKRGFYETSFTLIAEHPNDFPDYEITDRFTALLEKQIRNKPEYYLWTHRRFKHRKKIHEPQGLNTPN